MRAIAATLAISLLALPAAAQDTAAPASAPAAAASTVPATTVPATAPPTTETAPPAPATPAPTEGTLSVTSTPPGKLFIDDKDTGLVTPVVDLAVAAGPHTVKVVAEDGRSQSAEFTMEAGGSLALSLALPEPAAPAKTDEAKPAEEAKPAAEAKPAEAPKPADWTWMTVTGWSGLGLGTIGLLSGAVVLTTPTDPQQAPLGFGLFGAGVGMVLGGAVLLYLDNELSAPAPAASPAG